MAIHTANVVILNSAGEIDADLFSVAPGTTTTLAPGTPATVANSGTSQHQVWDIGIPQGDKGDKGDTGPAGGIPVDLTSEAVDLNTLTTVGAFYIEDGSTNLPTGAPTGGILEVFSNQSNAAYLYQVYIANAVFGFRSSLDSGSTWSAWAVPPSLIPGGTFTGDIKSTTTASIWAPRKRVTVSKAANYTVLDTDDLIYVTGSSAVTISFPVGMDNKEVTVCNASSATVTLTGSGGSIVVAGTNTLLPSSSATLVYDPTGYWRMVSSALATGTVAGTLAAGNDSRIVNAVPNTRMVNSKPLSADVVLAPADVKAVANATGQTLTLWKGTQAQYTALGTYDANTVYVVSG